MIGVTTLPHVFWCAHSFVQKKEMLAFLLQNGAPKNMQNYLGRAKFQPFSLPTCLWSGSQNESELAIWHYLWDNETIMPVVCKVSLWHYGLRWKPGDGPMARRNTADVGRSIGNSGHPAGTVRIWGVPLDVPWSSQETLRQISGHT